MAEWVLGWRFDERAVVGAEHIGGAASRVARGRWRKHALDRVLTVKTLVSSLGMRRGTLRDPWSVQGVAHGRARGKAWRACLSVDRRVEVAAEVVVLRLDWGLVNGRRIGRSVGGVDASVRGAGAAVLGRSGAK